MLIDDNLRLTKTSVGPMDNNAYLLTFGDDALLIDAAAEADVLLNRPLQQPPGRTLLEPFDLEPGVKVDVMQDHLGQSGHRHLGQRHRSPQ